MENRKAPFKPWSLIFLAVFSVLFGSCHRFARIHAPQEDVRGRPEGTETNYKSQSLSESYNNAYDMAAEEKESWDDFEGDWGEDDDWDSPETDFNTEEYDRIHENGFRDALKNPLSTFSIDVDVASYTNCRRFLNDGALPYKDAVRIEEFINYFNYEYPQPTGDHPFSFTAEVGECPWANDHQLLHIGLQGKEIPTTDLPSSNLVFLIDVSGSMDSHNKLDLLKKAFKLLIDQIRTNDRVAVVVYAGAAGVVLRSTPGDQKSKIIRALDQLQAGGFTAGGEGIELAYKIARENFLTDGNNRVILATDGDFNVGASSNAEMERLIEKKREEGIFLTVLGFGMGNYKDSKMEILADKGNGNYAYIDNLLEAKKVLVNEFGGTLFTIAKDVKLQLEFNPAKVKGYRLIAYENRVMKDEDFNNDKKDAGELGSGHTVTALYEIIPAGSEEKVPGIDELKYQQTTISPAAQKSSEMLTIKFRYKAPQDTTSKLFAQTVKTKSKPLDSTTDNFRFSTAVAGVAMLLRDSRHKGNADYTAMIRLAKSAKGKDEEGYRAEFIRLISEADLLAKVD